jgi:hypothetical protein
MLGRDLPTTALNIFIINSDMLLSSLNIDEIRAVYFYSYFNDFILLCSIGDLEYSSKDVHCTKYCTYLLYVILIAVAQRRVPHGCLVENQTRDLPCATLQRKSHFCNPSSGNCAASVLLSTFMCLWAYYIYTQVRIFKVCHSACPPRRYWDSPNPSLASEWAPPPRTALACGWGAGGVPIPTTWEKLSTLPTLCFTDFL